MSAKPPEHGIRQQLHDMLLVADIVPTGKRYTVKLTNQSILEILALISQTVSSVIGPDETKPMIPQTEDNIPIFRRVPVRNNLREEQRSTAQGLLGRDT